MPSKSLADSRKKKPHGQYFTPRHIANLMLSIAHTQEDGAVLEPSSGTGVFLDALCDNGYTKISAVEIDPLLAHHTRVAVVNQSFLSFKTDEAYDLIIGNPPYIRWRDLSNAEQDEVKNHSLFGELFNSLSDYLTVFIASSITLLSDGGELIFITPSFWMHTQHSKNLRDWMLDKGSISDIIEFGEAQVFPGVSSSIIIFRFVRNRYVKTLKHYRYCGPRKVPCTILNFDSPELFKRLEIRPFLRNEHWTIANTEESLQLERFEKACQQEHNIIPPPFPQSRIIDMVDIANGMVSGLDRAFRLPIEMHDQLTDQEKSVLLEVLKAKDISNIVSKGVTNYIYIEKGLTEEYVRAVYPHLFKHLSAFKEELLDRYSYNRDLPFWEWAFPRSEKFFFNGAAKGMVPCKERITNRELIRFTYARPGLIATQDVTAFAPHAGTRESLEYIISFLNTPQVSKWIRLRGLIKGGVAEFSERPLGEIPFRRINWQDPVEVEAHDSITALIQSAILNQSVSAQQHHELQAIWDEILIRVE